MFLLASKAMKTARGIHVSWRCWSDNHFNNQHVTIMIVVIISATNILIIMSIMVTQIVILIAIFNISPEINCIRTMQLKQ